MEAYPDCLTACGHRRLSRPFQCRSTSHCAQPPASAWRARRPGTSRSPEVKTLTRRRLHPCSEDHSRKATPYLPRSTPSMSAPLPHLLRKNQQWLLRPSRLSWPSTPRPALSCASPGSRPSGSQPTWPPIASTPRHARPSRLVAGFAAVLTLGWFGLRWLLGKHSLHRLVETAAQAHLLIWLGLAGLVASRALLQPRRPRGRCGLPAAQRSGGPGIALRMLARRSRRRDAHRWPRGSAPSRFP